MYKVKERSNVTSKSHGHHHYYYCSGGDAYYTANDAVTSTGTIERIVYEAGRKSASGRYLTTNGCRHTKKSIVAFPLTAKRGWDGTRYLYWHDSVYGYCVPTFAALEQSAPSQTTLDDFNARAFADMSPSLEGDLNLTNALLEIAEFKTMFNIFLPYKGRKHTIIDRVLGKVADTHLTWSFGIKPFISDAKALYSILSERSRIMQDFLDRRGKVQKRYYREDYEVDPVKSVVSTNYTNTWFKTTSSKTKLIATMTYTYDCPELDSLSMKVKALRDMLGLRLTAANIWEAIPFSFVVDWFFKVGDALERMQSPLIEPTVTVLDYSISYTVAYKEIRTYTSIAGCNGIPAIVDREVSRSVAKIYDRRRCLPNSGDYFTLQQGHFGLNQLALSGSLAYLAIRR